MVDLGDEKAALLPRQGLEVELVTRDRIKESVGEVMSGAR